jgi:hypothetical protein
MPVIWFSSLLCVLRTFATVYQILDKRIGQFVAGGNAAFIDAEVYIATGHWSMEDPEQRVSMGKTCLAVGAALGVDKGRQHKEGVGEVQEGELRL